ncbi:MAG: FkbM family methyltransferase [Reyranella sp.]
MNITNPVLLDIMRVRPNFQPAIIFSIGTHLQHGAREFRAAFPAAEIFSFDHAVDFHEASQGPATDDSKSHAFRIASTGAGTVDESGGGESLTMTAPVAAAVPSDSFCRDRGIERIDFLKIDAAGNDLDLLKALGGFLEAGQVEFVQAECAFSPEDAIHTPYPAMAEFLFAYGYRLFGFFNHSHRDTAAATVRNGIQSGTAVFVIDRTVKRPVGTVQRALDGAPQPQRQMESAFTQFYTTNKWGNKESKSGAGSTLAYTANLREKLPILVREHGIKSMFDAPCGDFNWMKEVKFDDDFIYMGGDIVADLIAHTAEKYSSPKRSFMRFDVVTDEFPKVDMWFCRDLLFHLPFKLGLSALENFTRSQIKFAMITTHVNSGTFLNKDTDRAGPFRLMDLFSPPFNFPLPLARVRDYVAPYPPREMCLWTREQVISALGERP